MRARRPARDVWRSLRIAGRRARRGTCRSTAHCRSPHRGHAPSNQALRTVMVGSTNPMGSAYSGRRIGGIVRPRLHVSNLVFGPQYLSCTLADDDTGSHGVSSHHARHDRAIRDAKIVDSIDLKVSVYDRQGIATHFCRTRLMAVSTGFVADEVFQFSPFQVARADFPSCVRSKRSRIANFAAKFDTS